MTGSTVTLFPGESLSNLDGLTSDNDDGIISPEIVTISNSLKASGRTEAEQPDHHQDLETDGKLQFSALLATLQPKQFRNKGKMKTYMYCKYVSCKIYRMSF